MLKRQPRPIIDRHLSVGLLALLPLLATPAVAEAADAGLDAPNPHPHGIYLDLPLVDLPFQTANGGSLPSMEQSLWASTDAYQGLHHALGLLADPHSADWRVSLGGKVLITVVDGTFAIFPGMLGWQHEEWHRAVMSWRGINSYNDVYKFKLFEEVTNVSHVTDEDLTRLKADHPADQVRMSTAGIEGNYAQALAIEKAQFFNHTRPWNTALLWILYIGNSSYLDTCSTTESDAITKTENDLEGTDVARRDFTGLDCDGWTYDLFRPDEPYAARGIHPSGVGINRYLSYSTLAPAEQRFIRNQYRLSLLNFVDPNLIGVQRMRWPWLVRGQPVDFNMALRYVPAAFGYDIRLDLFAQRAETQNLLVSLHGYFNRGGPLPGLEVALYRLPVGRLTGRPVMVGGRVAGWLQPDRLRYDAGSSKVGGLLGVRGGITLAAWCEPYVEVEAKSAGWVTGSVFLDANVSARTGLIAQF